MENNRNFKKTMDTFFALDSMLNGQQMPIKLSKKEEGKLIDLLKYALNVSTMKKFDQYIQNTFQSYIKNKKNIILDLCWFDHESVNKNIRKVIMNPLEEGDIIRDDGDMTNLFKLDMLKIFENVKTIKMILCYFEGETYVVSLVSILIILESFSLDKLTLVIADFSESFEYELEREIERVEKLYAITPELEKKYNEQNYDIKIVHKTGENNEKSWCIIEKK